MRATVAAFALLICLSAASAAAGTTSTFAISGTLSALSVGQLSGRTASGDVPFNGVVTIENTFGNIISGSIDIGAPFNLRLPFVRYVRVIGVGDVQVGSGLQFSRSAQLGPFPGD